MRGMEFFKAMAFAAVFMAVGCAYAENSSTQSNDKTLTKEDVVEAIKASSVKSQKIHADSLRVWKSYKEGDTPNYAYYYWARNIIFRLKKIQHIQLKSQDDIKSAFQIMADEKLISSDAVPVLAKFVWENLERRKGMSPLEKIMPDYRREKQNLNIDQLTQAKQES